MRAIIHIGTEKTGTTSIQEYLYQNQEALKNRGFYFIQSAGKKNNRSLPSYCMDLNEFDDFFIERGINTVSQKLEFRKKFLLEFHREIKSLPESIHTVIISSEHFHSRTKNLHEIQLLKATLAPYFSDFKIICYLREQNSLCHSFYSTLIKTGAVESLEEFVTEECHISNVYFNYENLLSNWEKTFGVKALQVSLFDKVNFSNNCLLEDFTKKIDLALISELNKKVKVQNESLSYVGQEILRAINGVLPYYVNNGRKNPIRLTIQKYISEEFKGRGATLSEAIQNEIFHTFQDSNERVKMKYFPSSGALFDNVKTSGKVDKKLEDRVQINLEQILNIILLPLQNIEELKDWASFLRSENKRLLAKEASALGQIDKAERLFKDALKNESNFAAYRDYSIYLMQKGDYNHALKLCEIAIKLKPNRPWLKELKSSITNRSNKDTASKVKASSLQKVNKTNNTMIKSNTEKNIPTPLIIWTFRRTGGTNLGQALFSSINLPTTEHEPFNVDRVYGEITQNWLKTNNEVELKNSLEVILSKQVSIKHCLEIIPDRINEMILELSLKYGYKHLFLYRELAPDRLLSLNFAQKSGIWGKEHRLQKTLNEAIFSEPIEAEKLIQHEKACRSKMDRIYQRLISAEQHPLSVSFESLYQDAYNYSKNLVTELFALLAPESESLAEFKLRKLLKRGGQGTKDEYMKFAGSHEFVELAKGLGVFKLNTIANASIEKSIDSKRLVHFEWWDLKAGVTPGQVVASGVLLNEENQEFQLVIKQEDETVVIQTGLESGRVKGIYPNVKGSSHCRFISDAWSPRGKAALYMKTELSEEILIATIQFPKDENEA